MNRFLFLVLSSLFAVIFSCEKDDICLPENLTTSRLVIETFNQNNLEEPASPDDFYVRPVGTEKELAVPSGSRILLPLKVTEEYTDFEFILNYESEQENIDKVRIHYTIEDEYINRACGFRTTFLFKDPPATILENGDNWIQSFVKKKDTITDEGATHLHLIF